MSHQGREAGLGFAIPWDENSGSRGFAPCSGLGIKFFWSFKILHRSETKTRLRGRRRQKADPSALARTDICIDMILSSERVFSTESNLYEALSEPQV